MMDKYIGTKGKEQFWFCVSEKFPEEKEICPICRCLSNAEQCIMDRYHEQKFIGKFWYRH